MKISKNWIQEFVDLPQDLEPAAFSRLMTLRICEVEGVEITGAHLSQVFAAKVLSLRPHPDAEKLRLVTVDHGQGQIELVCGAHNFDVGAMVAYAGLGCVLPGGFEIKKAKIRGVESLGMLCAEDELGFGEDHDGLMLLPPETQPGTALSELFPDQLDWVLEIDNKSVTHRPDLWGHYGFAREFSAVFDVPLKPYPASPPSLDGGPCPIQVKVEVPELVPRYTGLFVEGLAVKPSTPAMRHRLHRVGLRPINNLVDVTNYVMCELGQPMHAFDGSKIAGNQLTIRRGQGEKLMTLYQKEVTLTTEDLTIADAAGPSVVAGVIGGLDSGVAATATSCFLEAANWEPVTVRKSAARIGLRTDASQRFEKALAPETTEPAIWRALELLTHTCPDLKPKGGLSDHWGLEYPEVQVHLSYGFINHLLGTQIDPKEIDRILDRLGYDIQAQGDRLTLTVPPARRAKDLSIPQDVAEDVGRIFGLEKIEPQAALFPVERPQFNRLRQTETRCKKALAQLGFHEIYSYPLTQESTEAPFGLSQDPQLVLLNPVIETQDRMRTSLLPHLAQRIHANQKLGRDFKLFELSRIYHYGPEGPFEPNRLALARAVEPGAEPGKAFYSLKADLIDLLGSLQIPQLRFEPLRNPPDYQHPYIAAEVYSAQTHLGSLFGLSPKGYRSFDLKGEVVLCQLDFDALFAQNKAEYFFEEPSRFPAVNFELSLLVPKRVRYQEVARAIESYNPLVCGVRFLDVYYAKELGEDKSLSVGLQFRAQDRTLSAEETKNLQEGLIAALAERGFQLR
ncbi:MAG: phenylalanine--tRNA ligase subunit beta [bacterium]|nr:phenylalanine--tRNA ligase subunit beta [bacterium]